MTSSSSSSSSASAAPINKEEESSGLVDPALLAGAKKFATANVEDGSDIDTSDSEFAWNVLGRFSDLMIRIGNPIHVHLIKSKYMTRTSFYFCSCICLPTFTLIYETIILYHLQVVKTVLRRMTMMTSRMKYSLKKKRNCRKVLQCQRWSSGECPSYLLPIGSHVMLFNIIGHSWPVILFVCYHYEHHRSPWSLFKNTAGDWSIRTWAPPTRS